MTNIMTEIARMNTQEFFFWACALLGLSLLLIQCFLSLFGIIEDYGAIDAGVEGAACSDIQSFTWISKYALSGFIMMVGWTGLACRKELALPSSLCAVGACIGGFLIFLAHVLIFKSIQRLKSTGTVFDIANLIGQEATVYQRVSKNRVGKILVSVHNLTYEVDAISEQDADIISFTTVLVVRQVDEKTVMVIPKK